MEAKSTAENSWVWRVWHGLNYFIGGGTFLLGSLALFPSVNARIDAAEVSAWLYIIGSLTFLLADVTEWLHYTARGCPFLEISVNYFVTVFASLLFLVGSVCFIPVLELAWLGNLLFILGSSIIVLSQGWKLWRMLSVQGKTVRELIEEDESGFYVDLFAGLGGGMYLLGTFVFDWSAFDASLLIPAVVIYSFGGLFFFGSGLFLQKRYFFDSLAQKEYASASGSTSSEI